MQATCFINDEILWLLLTYIIISYSAIAKKILLEITKTY